MLFSEDFLKSLTHRVESLESQSSVELVVVVAKGSGHYRDVDHLYGFLSSCVLVLLAVYSPLDFEPEMLLFWLVVGYTVGYLLSSRWNGPRRLLTAPLRRRRQALAAARAAFVDKGVDRTRDRSGVMLYLSHFERLAIWVADAGVEGGVPRALFNDLEARCATAKSAPELERLVLEGLDSLAQPLAAALPRREDDENELPNEIYIQDGGF